MAEYKSIDNEISRMKTLMKYGSQVENKHFRKDIVEHSKKGADGKIYGIIREGGSFVIKYMSDGSKPVLAENFDYIGGFRNKKDNTYDSYGKAIKNFDLKLRAINEAKDPNNRIIVESLDPSRKEYLYVEGTEEMRKTIARQRQIMINAQIIKEGKNSGPCKGCGTVGDAKKKGAPFGSKSNDKGYVEADENPYNKDGEPNKVNEEEVLAWNDNPDYMDKSHGTEIGDGKPFDKCPKSETKTQAENGTVDESVQEPAPNEVNDWDKGLPEKEGTGKVETEDGKPFDKKVKDKVNEGIFETDDDAIESLDAIDDTAEQPLDAELDNPDEAPVDGTMGDEDFSSMLQQILDKLNNLEAQITDSQFGDDELYDDGEGDSIDGVDGSSENAPELDSDVPTDDDNLDMHEERQLKEEKTELNDFGKHPAYQKEPFDYPNPNHQEKEGYHDWNDDSVEGAKPYGQSIGDGNPFTENPEIADNSIAEEKMFEAAAKVMKEAIQHFFAKKQK